MKEILEQLKSNELLEKQKKWDEIAAEIEGITDKLGKPIERGIKEMVIALNALGFETSGSCEGHIKGIGEGENKFFNMPPWVDLAKPGSMKLYWRREAIIEKYGETHEFSEDPEFKILEKELSLNTKQASNEIKELLQEFYEDRNIPEEEKLITSPYIGEISLTFQGSPRFGKDKKFQSLKKEEFRKKLLKFQAEINEFAEFLKNKYFES